MAKQDGSADLWAGVLTQAFHDACKMLPARSNKERTRDRLDILEARNWLLGSRDMTVVCDLAGIDASAVKATAERIAAAGWTDHDLSERIAA